MSAPLPHRTLLAASAFALSALASVAPASAEQTPPEFSAALRWLPFDSAGQEWHRPFACGCHRQDQRRRTRLHVCSGSEEREHRLGGPDARQISADGDQAVTTIEELSSDGSHPVQRTWIHNIAGAPIPSGFNPLGGVAVIASNTWAAQ